MRYLALALITFFTLFSPAIAQKKWTLPECIEYAMNNNISIKQTDLQSKLSEIQLKQSRQSLYPNVNFSASSAINNGPGQDASFAVINQGYLSAGMQLQSSVEIFNWYSKKNTIVANQWELAASKAATDKLKNDIALSVANIYLQILLSKEQENIARVQLQQSQAQLVNTRKLVNAGALPELNASELEAQVARDSATLISAGGVTTQNILNLKAYMSLDAAEPFEVATPPVALIPVEKLGDLQPDAVYASALANMPQQKFNDYKLKAAQKQSEVAKAGMYPTVSLFGNFGTGYSSQARSVTGITPRNDTLAKVTVSGTDYYVFPYNPLFFDYSYKKTGLFKQLDQNFRQSVGVSVSVPIFSGGSLRANYERSKISIQNQELQKQLDDQKLKQDIYQAYNAAVVAFEKFNASNKSVQTAERSFSFSQKRFDVGLLSTFELITNQNNLFRAKLEYALNQVDYVFKMKVLEFYKGLGLKL